MGIQRARSMSVPFVGVAFGRILGCKDYLVSAQGVGQTGQRHLLSSAQGTEEGFELRLVRMVRDISRIEQLHRKLAPPPLIQAPKLGGIEFIVEQASFASNQMDMEVVRLKTINDRCDFADAAILKL